MKRNTLKTGVVLFGIVMISTVSYGQSEHKPGRKKPPTYEHLISEMDKNEDGKLSKDEVKGPLKDSFSEIDSNEDGFLSETEFKKAPKPKRKERKDRK
ncbi:EF-hand domain-containing protein [Bizionia paragorgiae]|uniref:EF-hand domain-containing protein n=1 Tax=Flavobacteriaceae TaxID=49546 RepID=UPI00299E4A20|nr:EF-hand domain-containing protein [Bizionia paragorgiae]MDX1272740.1 EF-hand domain-containing protein [Bizionia paragorgiae]